MFLFLQFQCYSQFQKSFNPVYIQISTFFTGVKMPFPYLFSELVINNRATYTWEIKQWRCSLINKGNRVSVILHVQKNLILQYAIMFILKDQPNLVSSKLCNAKLWDKRILVSQVMCSLNLKQQISQSKIVQVSYTRVFTNKQSGKNFEFHHNYMQRFGSIDLLQAYSARHSVQN